MKFMKRLKSDKKFRFIVVLIIVMTVIVYGEIDEQKASKKLADQPSCNLANRQTVGDFCDFDIYNPLAYGKIGSDICIRVTGVNMWDVDKNTCLTNKCYIGRGDEIWADTFGCFDCVPAGLWTREGGRACCGPSIEASGPGTYNYLCQIESVEDKCEGDFEQTLADILYSIWSGYGGSCKSAFFIVAGVGGMMAFMMIGMMF